MIHELERLITTTKVKARTDTRRIPDTKPSEGTQDRTNGEDNENHREGAPAATRTGHNARGARGSEGGSGQTRRADAQGRPSSDEGHGDANKRITTRPTWWGECARGRTSEDLPSVDATHLKFL